MDRLFTHNNSLENVFYTYLTKTMMVQERIYNFPLYNFPKRRLMKDKPSALPFQGGLINVAKGEYSTERLFCI